MIKPMKNNASQPRIPKQPRMQTEWNLGLIYKGDNDPQIMRDVADFELAVAVFERKYSINKKWLTTAKTLASACKDYEILISHPGCIRPRIYFYFRRDTNHGDTTIRARMTDIENRYDKILNRFIFFTLDIGRISVAIQQKFRKEKVLAPYSYFLHVIWNTAQHDLSEAEEKILTRLNQPAREMWIDGLQKVLNKQEIMWKGVLMPVTEAFGRYYSLPITERRMMWNMLMQKMIEISDFAEAEINALFYRKNVIDELRGFKKPYSNTVMSYQNEEATVDTLVSVVTKHFPISHRFFKLKARMMKEKYLEYADRGAEIGDTKTPFLFADAVDILQKAFAPFDKKYVKILNSYLLNGQIDVFAKKGKRGGAYCWGAYNIPNFVLLNHANNFNSVMTFGHEMGHAFHSELSKAQRPLYNDYTIAVAEVASTFFENLVFEEAFGRLSEAEKIIALHDKISGKISSVFRQIACFNFEHDAHMLVRSKGFASKEDLAQLMNKHMSAYLGPVFKIKPEDGYFFVGWSHIRKHFYVYSYAFGELVSDALFAKYKKDATYRAKIEQFLSAGGSASPEDIFASVGIDVRHPKFFEEGLAQIEADIAELERLMKNK